MVDPTIGIQVTIQSHKGTKKYTCLDNQTCAQILSDCCYPKEIVKLIKNAFFKNAYETKHELESQRITAEKEYKEFLNLMKELD